MPASDPANTMPQTRAALDRLDDLTLEYPGPRSFGKGTVIAWINLSFDDQSAAHSGLEAFAALMKQAGRTKWPSLANYIQTKRWRFLPQKPPVERRSEFSLSLFISFLRKANILPSADEIATLEAAWPTTEFRQVDAISYVDRYIAAADALARPLDFPKWLASRDLAAVVRSMERETVKGRTIPHPAAAAGHA